MTTSGQGINMRRNQNKSELMLDDNGKATWGERKPRSAERSGHYWQTAYSTESGCSPPLPEKPLEAYPGTRERIIELEQRAARGEHLWHPDDPASFEGFTGPYSDVSIFGSGPRKQRS